MLEKKHHIALSHLPPEVSEDDLKKLVDENTSVLKAWIIEDETNPRVILELSDGTDVGATAVAELFDGHYWKGHKLRAAMILMGEDE